MSPRASILLTVTSLWSAQYKFVNDDFVDGFEVLLFGRIRYHDHAQLVLVGSRWQDLGPIDWGDAVGLAVGAGTGGSLMRNLSYRWSAFILTLCFYVINLVCLEDERCK